MAALTTADQLRYYLGESVPEGGTAEDTLFSDAVINDLLTKHSNVVDDCLGEGWEIKAAALANLVDVVEGDQQRRLSQSHKAALEMADHFRKQTTSDVTNRTRVKHLSRGGFPG